MRKQTKIAAIVSATALLAIGASMTSFAATGWQEENGTWVYYDRFESMVTNEWAKSGDNWFYLGDNGEMVRDAIIEHNDNIYYVDSNGAMVRNRWVEVDNLDENDDTASHTVWYYFQASGKAYKAPTSQKTSFKTINGKSYAFASDGKMLYGWVDGESTRQTGDQAWTNADYYLGDANDGARATGEWKQIAVVDETQEDPDQNYWFYFQANGKKLKARDNGLLREKTINGKKYGFDQNGKMVYEWNKVTEIASGASATIDNYAYFSDPEDGAKKVKGWFKVVPEENVNKKAFDDESEKWFYANGRGQLYKNALKTINGKKYLFDAQGEMRTGLIHLTFESGKLTVITALDGYKDVEDYTKIGGKIVKKVDEKVDEKIVKEDITKGKTGIYYFVSNGDMQTGNQSVSVDGDSYSFKFKTSGTAKGAGIDGEDGGSYYVNGRKVVADSDEIYNVYKVVDKKIEEKVSAETLVDRDYVKFKGSKEIKTDNPKYNELKDKKEIEYVGSASNLTDNTTHFVVINNNGSVIKSGTRKDGNDLRLVIQKSKLKGAYIPQ